MTQEDKKQLCAAAENFQQIAHRYKETTEKFNNLADLWLANLTEFMQKLLESKLDESDGINLILDIERMSKIIETVTAVIETQITKEGK